VFGSGRGSDKAQLDRAFRQLKIAVGQFSRIKHIPQRIQDLVDSIHDLVLINVLLDRHATLLESLGTFEQWIRTCDSLIQDWIDLGHSQTPSPVFVQNLTEALQRLPAFNATHLDLTTQLETLLSNSLYFKPYQQIPFRIDISRHKSQWLENKSLLADFRRLFNLACDIHANHTQSLTWIQAFQTFTDDRSLSHFRTSTSDIQSIAYSVPLFLQRDVFDYIHRHTIQPSPYRIKHDKILVAHYVPQPRSLSVTQDHRKTQFMNNFDRVTFLGCFHESHFHLLETPSSHKNRVLQLLAQRLSQPNYRKDRFLVFLFYENVWTSLFLTHHMTQCHIFHPSSPDRTIHHTLSPFLTFVSHIIRRIIRLNWTHQLCRIRQYLTLARPHLDKLRYQGSRPPEPDLSRFRIRHIDPDLASLYRIKKLNSITCKYHNITQTKNIERLRYIIALAQPFDLRLRIPAYSRSSLVVRHLQTLIQECQLIHEQLRFYLEHFRPEPNISNIISFHHASNQLAIQASYWLSFLYLPAAKAEIISWIQHQDNPVYNLADVQDKFPL
jgi:hypothetical protein